MQPPFAANNQYTSLTGNGLRFSLRRFYRGWLEDIL